MSPFLYKTNKIKLNVLNEKKTQHIKVYKLYSIVLLFIKKHKLTNSFDNTYKGENIPMQPILAGFSKEQ